MPKGLDPNASFRRPVEATDKEPKILVSCNLLEGLISMASWSGSVPYVGIEEEIETLENEIVAARKAHEAHRG